MTDLLALANQLKASAKANRSTVYDAAFELAHDYVAAPETDADRDAAEEKLAEIAYHLANLTNALLKA